MKTQHVLFGLAAVFGVIGCFLFVISPTIVQEIGAISLFIIAAIFIIGAALIEGIEEIKDEIRKLSRD